jgi:formate dehydrogenase subunit gamma
MTTTTADAAQHTIRRVLDDKRHLPGALIPILHAIQDELAHVPPAAVADIAEAHGVISS